jgi:hypothetical protein
MWERLQPRLPDPAKAIKIGASLYLWRSKTIQDLDAGFTEQQQVAGVIHVAATDIY